MRAERKKRRAARPRRPATARPSESQIYDGRRFLGTLLERGREFTARTADGRKIAKFSTLREAMAALADAGRAAPGSSESLLSAAPARAGKP
jgi:hypothetical protein